MDNFANGLRTPMQVIHYSAQKLTARINNVLNTTEIENNTYYIRKEFFNLMDLLDQLSSYHCHNNFYKHKVNYQISYHGDKIHYNLPMVYADKNKIKLLIDNILINAIDYAKAKELYISIIKHQQNGGSYLCNNDKSEKLEIRITDDGIGIDDPIFEEMFSKYKTNFDDGLGLGLNLAKSIIEAHGGQIWAQHNKDGKGANISFCIPVNE